MKKITIFLLCFHSIVFLAAQTRIDRKALVQRHTERLQHLILYLLYQLAMENLRFQSMPRVCKPFLNYTKKVLCLERNRNGLRLYLPRNGGLLAAIAMMCAGYEGSTEINPGIPKNGKWKVKWEGLRKMP